jgi:hypothetical protein
MPIAAKLDELGKPAWIALMVLGFFVWWPLGLGVLAFLLGSGRMGCWQHNGMSRWENKMARMQDKMDRVRAKMDTVRNGGGEWWSGRVPSSGNRAFDDYRNETLRRLEEEQREFRDFLDRLRFAKDKTEFDAFMAERRARYQDQGPQSGPSPQN